MSRPVCQVVGCLRPAECQVDSTILGGGLARVRMCGLCAESQARHAQEIYLDVTMQRSRKRT